MTALNRAGAVWVAILCTAFAQDFRTGPGNGSGASLAGRQTDDPQVRGGYILGPGDQITVRVPDLEEAGDKPMQIDTNGFLRFPLIGRMKVSGLTVDQFERYLTGRLKTYLVHPDVTIAVSTFKSQPVSVVGSVKNPGVYQVEGRKCIIEVLSLAGGLDPAAGYSLRIYRRLDYGRIPLKGAADDRTGRFSMANVDLKSLLHGDKPEDNIEVEPYDVISVPRAELVYVIGQVQKAGGFALNEQESITVLKAVALAGGLDRTASPKNARILRAAPGQSERTEIPVNLKKIIDGKASDFALRPEDILYVPNSAPKRAAARAAEAAIQVGTGIVIWRR